MFCGVLHSRAVYADTQMRVHKALVVDYRIGCKFSLLTRKKLICGSRRAKADRNHLKSVAFFLPMCYAICVVVPKFVS